MASTHICMYECIMRAGRQSPDSFKMPSQPVKQEFKFHCIADDGYIWDFHPITTRQILILFAQLMSSPQQEKLYTISDESSLVLCTGSCIWMTIILQFRFWEDCIMICIWEPVTQHILHQLIFHHNSKFQNKLFGNMSTIPWNYSPLITSFLASWLVHVCGMIKYQLQFPVQYVMWKVSRRGEESVQGGRTSMRNRHERPLAICTRKWYEFLSAVMTAITIWML